MILKKLLNLASLIKTTVTNFGGLLSASDDTVQKALDTLDDHTHPAEGTDHASGSDNQTADTVPTEDSGISVQDALNSLEVDKHAHTNKSILDNIQEALTTTLKNAYDAVVSAFASHKDAAYGVHSIESGDEIAGISDIAVDANLSSAAQDAISKKHSSGSDNQTAVTVPTEDSGITVQDALNLLETDQHIHINKSLLDSIESGDLGGGTDDQTASEVPTTETGYSVQDHINDINNPHQVTKTQIGLSNVTNDAQLIRESGDFNTFEEKVTPESGDIILIEDASNGYGKKKVLIGNLPGGVGGGHTQNTDTKLLNESGEEVISNANIKHDITVDSLKKIDGRDLSVDGTKLDTIENNAVALATVKADADVASAISLKHATDSDTLIKRGDFVSYINCIENHRIVFGLNESDIIDLMIIEGIKKLVSPDLRVEINNLWCGGIAGMNGLNETSPEELKDAVDKKHASGSDNQVASTVDTEDSGINVQEALNSLESNVVNFSDINNILANQIFN